jgi:hypothetical protein
LPLLLLLPVLFLQSNDRAWLDSIIELSSLNDGYMCYAKGYLNDFGFGYKIYLEKVFSSLLRHHLLLLL